jgi:3-methyladenine DNA glycosylase AlkC
MRHIAIEIDKHLTDDYKKNIDILKITFLKMNHSFYLENMIFQDYVEVYGIDYFDISMDALKCFTINSSSEFAIRAFIIKYETKTIKLMQIWAKSSDFHIRRLASEGCRPRLPWAIGLKQFQKDPNKILNILDLLKDDKNEYVKKSVANNLNDISKDNPEVIKTLLKKWIGDNQDRDWVLKHGARGLLKQGDLYTLSIFGFHKPTHIKINYFNMQKSINVGENLNFIFELTSQESLGKLRIEFAIEFLRKNNKHNKKVFQLSEGLYKENSKRFSKFYSFKPISTRAYYKGKQKFHLIINGEIFISKEFQLD